MRKYLCIFMTLVFALCLMAPAGAEEGWDLRFYLDEFDDPTDHWYLVTNAEGTFNNSATTRSLLKGKILADEKDISFILYEYGDLQVINSSTKMREYQIRVKDPQEDIWTLSGYMLQGADRIFLDTDSKELFIKSLKLNGSFSISITDIDRTTDKYVLKFVNSGFDSLYSGMSEIEESAKGSNMLNQTVLFGNYPQNSAEKEPIEWIILDINDQKAMLISKIALDCQPYNEKSSDVTWETCTLRNWLNSEFLNSAFTPEEQEMILWTEVDNSREQGYNEWYKGLKNGQPSDNTYGGNNTNDKVYLLSCAEATKYFGAVYGTDLNPVPNDEALLEASSFARARPDAKYGWYEKIEWWLRSPGYFQSYAANVSYHGDYSSNFVTVKYYVRPVIWVDLDAMEKSAAKTVGNHITLGIYPQASSGKDKPIEWTVLDVQDNKVLLISRYGLDVQPYNEGKTDVTWEKCTLRKWLNETFLSKAFTTQEQARILLTNVDNSSGQSYWSTDGGSNTEDKIFLLSYAEANKYLGVTKDKNTKSRVAPTEYAIQAGASTKTEDGKASCWWWLRSPGSRQDSAAGVRPAGSLDYSNAYFESGCVRPAMWIELEAGTF